MDQNLRLVDFVRTIEGGSIVGAQSSSATTIFPTATFSLYGGDDWDPIGDATQHTCVDDPVADDDTTYIRSEHFTVTGDPVVSAHIEFRLGSGTLPGIPADLKGASCVVRAKIVAGSGVVDVLNGYYLDVKVGLGTPGQNVIGSGQTPGQSISGSYIDITVPVDNALLDALSPGTPMTPWVSLEIRR